MSRKQEIYRDMLFFSLPWIRNVQTWPWWRRTRDRTCYDEAELVHTLCHSICLPEFVAHDIHFFNCQAREYYERGHASPFYAEHVERIRELFRLVPESMRSELTWSGPDPSCEN